MRFILKFQLELVRRRSSFSEGIDVLQNSCKKCHGKNTCEIFKKFIERFRVTHVVNIKLAFTDWFFDIE